MARFVRGDVVVVPFPKRRPALILATLGGDDLILCQITSQTSRDQDSILLEERDFSEGRLSHLSNIRPNRLFTADRAIILYRVGSVLTRKLDDVVNHVVEILRG